MRGDAVAVERDGTVGRGGAPAFEPKDRDGGGGCGCGFLKPAGQPGVASTPAAGGVDGVLVAATAAAV